MVVKTLKTLRSSRYASHLIGKKNACRQFSKDGWVNTTFGLPLFSLTSIWALRTILIIQLSKLQSQQAEIIASVKLF
jgi:hypothetical protein